MKIKCDDKEIMVLSTTQLKCIQNDIPASECAKDLERRLCYVLQHKYEQCFKRLKEEWEPRLKAKGVQAIPLDEEAFCELVFSQPDYKDREAREVQNKETL